MPTDCAAGIWVRPFRTFIGCGHQPWTASRDDVTSLSGQFLSQVAYRSIDPVIFGNPGRAENRHAVAIAAREP